MIQSLYVLAALALLVIRGQDPVTYIQSIVRGRRVRQRLGNARAMGRGQLRNAPLSLQ